MKEIISLILVAGSLLGVALSFRLYGLLKRKKRMRYLALASLLLGGLVAGLAVYRLGAKSYRRLADAVRPRTGEEIYTALFGPARPGCLQVIDYQDQVVPRIDYAIWLHYHTCPGELRRLLMRHPFDGGKEPTAQWPANIPLAGNIKWFQPQAMGDTILVYEYATERSRNIQTFWASRDSTEVFYRDIAD